MAWPPLLLWQGQGNLAAHASFMCTCRRSVSSNSWSFKWRLGDFFMRNVSDGVFGISVNVLRWIKNSSSCQDTALANSFVDSVLGFGSLLWMHLNPSSAST